MLPDNELRKQIEEFFNWDAVRKLLDAADIVEIEPYTGKVQSVSIGTTNDLEYQFKTYDEQNELDLWQDFEIIFNEIAEEKAGAYLYCDAGDAFIMRNI